MRIPCYRGSWRWMTILMVAILAVSGARAANVAVGKPAFASFVTENAGLATDNSQTTLWQPSGSPSSGIDWLAVDLETATVVKGIRVYWGDTRPQAFTIQVATSVTSDINDPSYGQGDWQTINTFTGGETGGVPPSHPYYVEIATNTSAYRYVRVNTTAAPNADWGIRELQVLDAPLAKITGTARFGGSGVAETIATLAGPSGSFKQEVTAGGAYSFPGLDPGTYTLRAIAAGRYAPVFATIIVADADVAQDITFTTPVVNITQPLPSYSSDFIASGNDPFDHNAAVAPLAMPAEYMPPGNQVWTTNTPLPFGAMAGENLPSTLKFHMPPTEDGKNNLLTALGINIPFAPANYTAIYFLQTAIEGNYYTHVTLHYADNTSEVVFSPAGSNLYGITRGDDPGAPAENLRASLPGDEEVIAFSFDEMYLSDGFLEPRPWNVYLRAIPVDSSKVLTSVEFDGIQSGGGSTTLSKGFLMAVSADALTAPPATGSIAGVVRAPNNTPVEGAIVNLGAFRLVTDATGAYQYNAIPAGEWTVSARKPAFYGSTTRNVTLAAGQNATGQDIQFAAPAAIMATGIGAPQADVVSTDANYDDFSWTGWMLGREYIPVGQWKPADGGTAPYFSVQDGAPDNLPFYFHDYGDTPIVPGQPGYPAGGTPNAQILSGSSFLAPPVKTTAVYLATVGIEGSNRINPILVYTDGTQESRVVEMGDWFGNPTPDEYPYIRMHGRHARNGESNFGEGTNIRLNAIIINVDPNKTLKELRFGQANNMNAYPSVFAISWETETPQPAPADVIVNVRRADNSPAGGAIVNIGPYNTRADANGVARFPQMPANLQIGIGAYINGLTKQARVNHTVTTGAANNINITLPSEAPIFVQLPLFADHDAFSMEDMPGDYKTGRTNDRGFIGEQYPASLSLATVANVPYRMPIKETFYNNMIRAHGQYLPVVPGSYSSLNLLITSPGIGSNTKFTYLTLHYSDGSSELVQFGILDWVKSWDNVDSLQRELFWRMTNTGSASPFHSVGRRGPGDDNDQQLTFMPTFFPVNAGKTLVGFELLPMHGGTQTYETFILAATLEANQITGQSATITGRVIGQPMGAAQAGPMPLTQVMLDHAHAAYTDANGNFTIPNAPVGAGSLKVIPYGSGIVSKSFPVTVTAGNFNAGDLNVGASTETIRIVLGETNDEQGLRLLQPYYYPTRGWNVGGAVSEPVVVDGKSGRETTGNRLFFDVDDGWLWRGMQGTNGLTITDRGLPTQTLGRLAPDIYMRIEFYDRGDDSFRLEYNRIERWTYNNANLGITDRQTTRLTSMWHRPSPEFIFKTDTNTWKTFIQAFPADTDAHGPFGAYNGQDLMGDFLIEDEGAPEIIHSITLSTTPDFAVPSLAADILRVAGGLAAADADQASGLDLNDDNVVDLLDAAIAARQQ